VAGESFVERNAQNYKFVMNSWHRASDIKDLVHSTRHEKPMARWIVWTLLTLLSWGIWAVLSKKVGGGISDAQLQAISTLGVLPVLAMLFAIKDSKPAINRRRGILIAFGSGVISCLGNIAFYNVLNQGANAAAVIPVTDLYPAVTVLLAAALLKERLSWVQWSGIGLSLCAIYFFRVAEDKSLISPWLLLALIPIVLWGICGLMQKMSTNDISGRSSAIWFLMSFIPIAVLILLFDPLPPHIPIEKWALAVALGFLLALGNLTVLLAFSSGGKASIITPLAGLYPVVSIPIAIFYLGEQIGWRECVGIALALAAVVVLSYPSDSSASLDSTAEIGVSS
jgi:drug/metabolite transporter (DMT)-like permease